MKNSVRQTAAACFVLGAAMTVFTGCGSGKTIDLADYVEFEENGYSGIGTVTAKFDGSKLMQDYDDIFLDKKLNEKRARKYSSKFSSANAELMGASGKLDKSEKLSDGDTVTFTWNDIDTKLISEVYGVNIKTDDITYTVSNLETPETVDLFEDLDVTFSGYSPYGTVTLKNGNSKFDYSADKKDGLKNGDTVTVKAEYDGSGKMEDYFISKGCVAGSLTKDYIVEGLSELEEFDPFENVNVLFEGTAPYAKLKFTFGNNEKVAKLYYEADTASQLKNGDTVRVTVSPKDNSYTLEEFCARSGYIPTVSEKTYTVEGVAEYILTAAELEKYPDNVLLKEADDYFAAMNARLKADNKAWGFDDFDFLGYHDVTPKDTSGSTEPYNYVYLVYKAKQIDNDGIVTPVYIYYCYEYVAVYDGYFMYNENRTFCALDKYGYFNDKFVRNIDGQDRNFAGYETLDDLYSAQVITKIDKYTCDSNVAEKKKTAEDS